MGKRTTIQLALLLMGLIVWGYGQRVDEPTLRLIGISLFAAASAPRPPTDGELRQVGGRGRSWKRASRVARDSRRRHTSRLSRSNREARSV